MNIIKWWFTPLGFEVASYAVLGGQTCGKAV